jgi:hypothetical protein
MPQFICGSLLNVVMLSVVLLHVMTPEKHASIRFGIRTLVIKNFALKTIALKPFSLHTFAPKTFVLKALVLKTFF